MKRTFLVAIETDAIDPASLQLEALDIQDKLEQGGFLVDSVKVWSSPGDIASISGLTIPPPQTDY